MKSIIRIKPSYESLYCNIDSSLTSSLVNCESYKVYDDYVMYESWGTTYMIDITDEVLAVIAYLESDAI